MFTKKISVIIPAYNIEDLIVKCIDSVVNQTYPAGLLEIIVVDDGSTDGTLSKINSYVKERSVNEPEIVVLHQKNGGSSAARNYGLSVATGDYIGFVDADDYVDPHMYESLMEAIEKYSELNKNAGEKSTTPDSEIMMAQISRDEIAEDGTRLPDVCIPPSDTVVISGKDHLRTLLMHTGDASYCTKLTKRELFTEECQGFPTGELNEDFYLMIHMLSRVQKMIILPQQYYHVFYRSGSNSRKKAEQKDYFPPVFTDIVRNSDVAIKLCSERFPDLWETAVRFAFVQRLDYLLHIPISQMIPENEFYINEVVGFIRSNKREIIRNRFLSRKNRIYLLLFCLAPRTVRVVHAGLRGIH